MEGDCEDVLPIVYTTTEPRTNSEEPKRCVVVMDRLRAVTFRHGGHKKFIQGQETKLYPVHPLGKVVAVVVAVINDVADFIVFHAIDADFPIYPYAVDGVYHLGQPYKMIGCDWKGRIHVKRGSISKIRGAYWIGDHHAEDEDSGAAILSHNNLFVGMCVAKPEFVVTPNMSKGATIDMGPITGHFSYPQILPMMTILANLPSKENEMLDAEPPRKNRNVSCINIANSSDDKV